MRERTDLSIESRRDCKWSKTGQVLKMQRLLVGSLHAYNGIARLQRAIASHCSKSLHVIIFLLAFTVIYPSLILFQSGERVFLIFFFAANYAIVLVGCLFPVVFFNSKFLSSNMNYLAWICGRLRLARHASVKFKISNLLILNGHSRHTFSFSYRSLMEFTSYFLFFWIIESITLILLFYQTSTALNGFNLN